MISTLISSSINAGQFRCRSNEKSISNLDYIALCMVFNSSLISLTATLESDSIVIWHVLLKDDGQASVNSPNFRFQAWVTYVLSIVAQHPFAIWICEKTGLFRSKPSGYVKPWSQCTLSCKSDFVHPLWGGWNSTVHCSKWMNLPVSIREEVNFTST